MEGKLSHQGEGKPLRIVKINTKMDVTIAEDQDPEYIELCAEKFKKYCVLTQSVMQGIPADIDVQIK